MKIILICVVFTLSLVSCMDDGPECDAGEMRCNNGVSQMCGATEEWENYRDCNATGEQCSMSPTDCSGYVGLACCY